MNNYSIDNTTVFYYASPRVASFLYDGGAKNNVTTIISLRFDKHSCKTDGKTTVRKIYDLPIKDSKGIFSSSNDELPDGMRDLQPLDKSAYIAARVIGIYVSSALHAVGEMNINAFDKESRVKEIIKMLRQDVLFRGNLRMRTVKGFIGLLQDRLNNMMEQWQQADTTAKEYGAPVRRSITSAYIWAVKSRSNKFIEGFPNNTDYTERFITNLQNQTREAALFNTSGHQKSAFLVIVKLISDCRQNGGKIEGAEFKINGIDGPTLNVIPETFLKEMGLMTTNRQIKSDRKNDIANDLEALRDRPFTLLQDTANGFVFSSRRNLFAFNVSAPREDLLAHRHGNDTLWTFSNLSELTLPLGKLQHGKTPFCNQYDTLPTEGIKHINSTYRSEIAQAATNIVYPILIATSTKGEIWDSLQVSENFETIYKKRKETKQKIFEATTTGLAIDGISVSFDKNGRYHAINPKAKEELDKKRALAPNNTHKQTDK